MTHYSDIQIACNAEALTDWGGFHPKPEDALPYKTQTFLLLVPDEPAFWQQFKKTTGWQDKGKNPVDRWSKRLITDLANILSTGALFPLGGAAFLPFYTWALNTRRVYSSPIKFLTHDTSGLFVSLRGALAFYTMVELSKTHPSPCAPCIAPCLSACPVSQSFGHDPEHIDYHTRAFLT